jgi:alginate O-acetyltransferase complex protein AlgI
MEFNSIEFFIFLISVLIVINCLRKSYYQQMILVAASYLFYWSTSNYFVLLLLFITVISYQSGEAIHSSAGLVRKKVTLAVALIFLLIPLGFFKYYNFGVEILSQTPLPLNYYPLNYYLNLPILGLLLPIGISFFTFSAISYVIDIYRGTIQPEDKFYRYALFISYFPHLLSGPIVRAGQFLPQLKNSIKLSPAGMKTGVTLMVWGFVKKFVIADNCAPVANAIFSHPTSFNSMGIIIGTIFFGIQIYCDFSGYIDIALGAAELVGLHLPQNFFRPYLSKNPTEFWRRWNITLSSFIRDYIYIPLGGNRKGTLRTYFNVEISMLLCGLWHGAAWNFILWGGYHGVLQSVYKYLSGRTGSFSKKLPSLNVHLGLFVKIFITQYFIFLGWIMFRVGNLSDMMYCIRKYVLLDFNFAYQSVGIQFYDSLFGAALNLAPWMPIVLVSVIIISLILLVRSDYWMKKVTGFLTTDWTRFFSSVPNKYWMLYLITMVFILLCFTPSASSEFIYYQF